MSSKSMRFVAALLATVVAILLLPFAVPVLSRVEGVRAFATGTVVHADALEADQTRLVDTEVAFSGAAYDSEGLGDAIRNEMDRVLAPSLPAKLAFGRGAALEVGLGVTPATENQAILAGKAEASALPKTPPVTTGAGPIDLDPLVWADLLRGQATANVADDGCVLGADASSGSAYVADAQLLDAASSAQREQDAPVAGAAAPAGEAAPADGGPVDAVLGVARRLTGAAPADAAAQPAAPAPATRPQAAAMPNEAGLEQPVVALDADGPARAVSQSRSRTVFVAQRGRDGRLLGNAFGIMSEVRQTIAPVTLFEGTDQQFTIEVLGEWVLQAVAGGVSGTGYVHYGPGRVSPETPVLRLIDAEGAEQVLRLQDITTDDGLIVTIPGVAEIAIGEPPRAIGGDAGSRPAVVAGGTSASAAVDVVRVRALAGAPARLADLRIGHMEASASVPAGGVGCQIPVSKTPSVQTANVGESFDVTFAVANPYDCTLRGVRLEDAVTTERDARFAVGFTAPAASVAPAGQRLAEGTLIWSNLGDLRPGQTRTVRATFAAQGGAGAIIDRATAFGTLADCAQEGGSVAGVDVDVVGSALTGTSEQVRVPTVATRVLSASGGRDLPLTGAPILWMVAAGLVMIAVGAAGMLSARAR